MRRCAALVAKQNWNKLKLTPPILREREELKKISQREAARAAEAAKPAADLNTTYEKPSSAKPTNKALDRTVNMDQQPQSYDMTPARHELPPEPLRDEDNYGEGYFKVQR